MAEYGEKTEQATPRKRQKAREKGQTAKSRDLSAIAAIGGIILVLVFGGRYLMGSLEAVTGRLLSLQYGRDPFFVLRTAGVETMLMLIPFFFASVALAVGTGAFQGGFVFKPLEFQFDGINPLSGIKRIFSVNGLFDFVKSLMKFIAGGLLFYFVIKNDLEVLPSLMNMDIRSLASVSGSLLMKAIIYGFLCFLVIGAFDFLLELKRFERSIKMTKEEIKEEFKEMEGDPAIKARIRSIQRDMARRRMMQEVPKAAVVITNPTHLAVALMYEDKKMAAPKIIAKGAGVIAEKIKEIARAHRIPVIEDKPLARVLYKLDLDSYIPKDLYKAVAKILAYIYRLRGTAA